ncbi:MAG: archease, partial [Planctomycetota bacterium]
LRVRGASPADLFEQAGNGFVSLLLDPERVSPLRTMAIAAEGGDPEGLLVAWLEEILFAFEVEGFAPASVRVESLAPGTVTGELAGEEFDPRRHQMRSAIKAVTYHDLAIRETDGRYEVSVVFDV